MAENLKSALIHFSHVLEDQLHELVLEGDTERMPAVSMNLEQLYLVIKEIETGEGPGHARVFLHDLRREWVNTLRAWAVVASEGRTDAERAALAIPRLVADLEALDEAIRTFGPRH